MIVKDLHLHKVPWGTAKIAVYFIDFYLKKHSEVPGRKKYKISSFSRHGYISISLSESGNNNCKPAGQILHP